MTISIGDTIRKRKVMGIKTVIHGKNFPNRNLTHVIALKGRRGGESMAYVNREGQVGSLIKGFGYFEGEYVLDGR